MNPENERWVFSRRSLLMLGSMGIASSVFGACGRSGTTETQIIQADFPGYASVEEFAARADVVVWAKFLDSSESLSVPSVSQGGDPQHNPQSGVSLSPQDVHEMSIPITLTRMRVVRSLSDELQPGDEFILRQLGGLKDGVRYLEASTPLIRDFATDSTVSEFFLVLQSLPNAQYDCASPQQGIMAIDSNGAAEELLYEGEPRSRKAKKRLAPPGQIARITKAFRAKK